MEAIGIDFFNLKLTEGGNDHKGKIGGQRASSLCTLGLSLDGGFGFPCREEVIETLMCGEAPGHYRAVVVRRGK